MIKNMTDHTRYAIYWTSPPGPLTDFAAAWLGWNPWTSVETPPTPGPGQPLGLAQITEEPRRYGFHATLKAPFRLAEGRDRVGLEAALQSFAEDQAAVRLDGLAFSLLSGFVALRPTGDVAELNRFAMRVVEFFDDFRAPLTEAEIARRRPETLSPPQRQKLLDWGYPYVGDDFRFHLTLTGRVSQDVGVEVIEKLEPHLAPLLPEPLIIDRIYLFGQRPDGKFEVLKACPLTMRSPLV
ncbi:DUF1045 domain-containing protein [Haematobacter genomosp. 1]|nr:DUF1045 domain-containing protein [Haematobacter genomosp. 1]